MDARLNTSDSDRLPAAAAAGSPAGGMSLASSAAAGSQPDDGPRCVASAVRQLILLRGIAVCGQSLTIAVALLLGVALPLAPMAATVVALVALNAFASARLRRGVAPTRRELALHLAVDLAALTVLLCLAGGAANPFCLLYLLHVTLIALLLPWRAAVAGAAAVLGCYALAGRLALPLQLTDGSAVAPALMRLGEGLAFTLTAVVIAWFVSRIVAVSREQDRLLQESARKAAADEAVLRIGTLAAGAAHELARPLATMAVVAEDLGRDADLTQLRRDAAVLSGQIAACRETLGNLMAAAGHARAEGGGREALDRFLEAIASRCRALRPGIGLIVRCEGTGPAPEILAEQSLKQAILILLNNAADVSPEDVHMTGRWENDVLRLAIVDRGSGLPAGSTDKLGRVFFTTKPAGQGTGLGLVLAANVVGRLGGTLRWSNRANGGACAEIELPLATLRIA